MLKWVSGLSAKHKRAIARIGILGGAGEAAARPLVDHLADFEESLRAKDTTEKHVKLTISRARMMIDRCGFKVWGDISASAVESTLRAMREGGEQIGKTTSNFYLRAIRQFCKRMVDDRRARENPLKHLRRLNEKTDVRVQRRALAADECRRLIRAAATGKPYFREYTDRKGKVHRVKEGIPGPEREVVYRVALETGLRAGELRSLKVSSFDLKGNPATVTVSARDSKHRREDVLPLRPDTAAILRDRLKGKLPAALALSVPPRATEMLREDLQAAKISHEDTGAGVVDFHALRHTFITNLANNGVHPSVAQALARHATVALTLERYTHTRLLDHTRALAALPDLSAPVAEEARATGTDDRICSPENVTPIVTHEGGKRGVKAAQNGTREGQGFESPQGEEDPIKSGVFVEVGGGEGSRTRTCDTRLKRPLLYRLSYAPVRRP